MSNTATTTHIAQRAQQLFEAQLAYAPQVAQSTYRQRLDKLDKIERYLRNEANRRAMIEAIRLDFRKHETETIISESGVVLQQISHAKKRLRSWMDVHYVPSPIQLVGSRSYIQYEPKGVCLIISPWNYPINLSLGPLVFAVAAGNTAIIKPSELTAHTAAFISDMISSLFAPEEVAVLEGDASAATALLNLPFHHIYFTGSPQVGKIVMQAAARHLASVTLELGGKSPTIIDETASIPDTALKTAWAKCLNAGQTCIAPDYLIIHESQEAAFIQAFQKAVARLYQPDGQAVEKSDSLARIINDRHFDRLVGYLEDALQQGGDLVVGGQHHRPSRFVAPTLIRGAHLGMKVMQEEIFGPILPIITYRQPEEIPALINQFPKALSFYIHSKRSRFIDYLLKHTSSGGVVINDYLLGFANPNLPFGGVNNSGIGKSLGFHGFKEFSNERGIIKRWLGDFRFIFPPYSNFKSKLAEFLLTRI